MTLSKTTVLELRYWMQPRFYSDGDFTIPEGSWDAMPDEARREISDVLGRARMSYFGHEQAGLLLRANIEMPKLIAAGLDMSITPTESLDMLNRL